MSSTDPKTQVSDRFNWLYAKRDAGTLTRDELFELQALHDAFEQSAGIVSELPTDETLLDNPSST